MKSDEQALLLKMGLNTNGSVHLACQTRIESGDVVIDLAFQNTYSPDDGDDA